MLGSTARVRRRIQERNEHEGPDPVKTTRYDHESNDTTAFPEPCASSTSSLEFTTRHGPHGTRYSSTSSGTSEPLARDDVFDPHLAISLHPTGRLGVGRGLQTHDATLSNGEAADDHHHKSFGSHGATFSMELSLRDPTSYLKCTHFLDDVPGYPCTRPRGFPHVLDRERYWYFNERDEFYEVPLIVDVATTLVYGLDSRLENIDKLNNPAYAHHPPFKYHLINSTRRLEIERKENDIKISFGRRGETHWETVLVYQIMSNGAWWPRQAKCVHHGRFADLGQLHQVDTVGTALGRTLMGIVNAHDVGDVHEKFEGGHV